MPLNPAYAHLEAAETALGFELVGEDSGNASVGKGALDGCPVHGALVQNRTASGSIGTVEAKRLGALLQVVARERSPLLLFLDSAGAKVSEGLRALGAFRRVYRDALGAALSGAPIVAMLGRNCYGGSSMLAHLASHRLFHESTQLAMSGPAILAAAAGMNVLDEMFRAMAEASIAAGSRAKASTANRVWDPSFDMPSWLRGGLVAGPAPAQRYRERHEALGRRLPPERAQAGESVRRRDLGKIYPGGYEARETAGFLEGAGRSASGEETFLGIVGKAPLSAERAWRFSQAAWQLVDRPAARIRVFLDCATHAARLDDERIVLSEFIVGMSLPLALLAARGTHVELTILGEAGGGVYVALAGPATHVSAVYGANIRVLPGSALTAILGEAREEAATAAEYRVAGVAEEELKLGIVGAE
jgi:hypothetical protein